jgi:hypothetical protein
MYYKKAGSWTEMYCKGRSQVYHVVVGRTRVPSQIAAARVAARVAAAHNIGCRHPDGLAVLRQRAEA